MINSFQILQEIKEENRSKLDSGGRFSFAWLADKVIERQKYGKDTIIVIIGERRNGKSNWMLKLVNHYIKAKRKDNPDFRWSWKDNFPITRSQAVELADKVPEESFIVYDEAGDVAYRGDTMSVMSKNLIKFLNKSGKKRLLTIFVLPDILQLDIKILNMCLMMVIVPYRYRDECAFAFIYGRTNNPLIQDKFGIEQVKRFFASRRSYMYLRNDLSGSVIGRRVSGDVTIPYPRTLFRYLKSRPNFRLAHRFSKVSEQFERRYIENVKNNQLDAHMEEEVYIKKMKYDKLIHKYQTVIYNLYTRADMSIPQIERLHIDSDGNKLITAPTLQKHINLITARVSA